MSRKARIAGAGDPAVPLPSREEIVSFIAREREAAGERAPPKIGKREIARAFNLKGADRVGLKRVLRDLEAEGTIERRRKALTRPGLLGATVLAEIYSRDRDGDLLAKPVEWNAAHGPAPTIVVTAARRSRPGLPAPGVGDRVLLHTAVIRGAERGEPGYGGRVVKVLPAARSRVLGIYRAGENGRGGGQVFPVDKKTANRGAFAVRPGFEGEALDGDLVAVEVLRGGRLGLPEARVSERVGSLASEKAVSLIAIHARGIPDVFSAEALAEAEAARPLSVAGREDWRALPLLTIDPADAKDHDDAVHAAADADPANAQGFVLTVAIADVAAYVPRGSALDRDALERGNSVYFPDRVVPMLPERISNDLCSLRAGVDRPALAMRLRIDGSGRKLGHSLHRVTMRSHARLSYAQAQAAIDGAPDEVTQPLLAPVLEPLWAAFRALVEARTKRQPLDLDLPERRIVLDADGRVERVVTPPRLDAHRLIEEFMILANVAAAEIAEERRQLLIYRAHGEPAVEKLHHLGEFLATIDIKLAKGQVLTPGQFNGILARVRGTEHEQIVNDVVLRTQAQAEYTPDNYGHFGLHLRRYAHFTSPIRRYADLVVHRALVRACGLGGAGGAPDPDPAKDELADVAERISAAERRAMAAERETADRLIAAHLADQVGATFAGRIAGVTRAGLFVRLDDTGADGFVPAATLGDEFFRFEEAAHALVGAHSGLALRLGDTIDVRLEEAAPFAGALRFALADAGGSGPGVKRSRRSAAVGRGSRRTDGRAAFSRRV